MGPRTLTEFFLFCMTTDATAMAGQAIPSIAHSKCPFFNYILNYCPKISVRWQRNQMCRAYSTVYMP